MCACFLFLNFIECFSPQFILFYLLCQQSCEGLPDHYLIREEENDTSTYTTNPMYDLGRKSTEMKSSSNFRKSGLLSKEREGLEKGKGVKGEMDDGKEGEDEDVEEEMEEEEGFLLDPYDDNDNNDGDISNYYPPQDDIQDTSTNPMYVLLEHAALT